MATSKKTRFMRKEIGRLTSSGPSNGPLKGQKFTRRRAVAAAINIGKSKGFRFGRKASEDTVNSIFDKILTERELTTIGRKHIKKKNFVFPSKAPGHGSFPVHDLSHAKNALSRAGAKGGAVEAAVKARVYKLYPGLKARHEKREGIDHSIFDTLITETLESDKSKLFDEVVSEGATDIGLFDEIEIKDVDESNDTRVDKIARTLTLTESLINIRNKVVTN